MKNIQPHQLRVLIEKADLDDKIQKLETFFTTPIYTKLCSQEQQLLLSQLACMQAYSSILSDRIALF